MERGLPEAITKFESFLRNVGLMCQRREGPDPKFFGNQLIQYGDNSIGLRIVSDRSEWTISTSDAAGRPEEWYDADLVREMLAGRHDGALSLVDQVAFFEHNWPEIKIRFSADRRSETRSQLAALGTARSKRLFGWPA